MDSAQLQSRYQSGERNFKGVAISGVNLVWVELPDINLRGADLSYANLSGANLSGANLSAGTLAFADLSRADLRCSNLEGARLEGANLQGVMLEAAVFDEHTRFPRGFNPLQAGAIAAGAIGQESTEAEGAFEPASAPVDREQFSAKTAQSRAAKASDVGAKSGLFERVDSSHLVKDDAPHRASCPVQAVQVPSERDFVPPPSFAGREVPQTPHQTASDWHQSTYLDWPKTVAQKAESYLANSSGQGRSSQLPAGIKSWNWGAFLLPWIWFVPNQLWIGILLWPLIFLPVWNFWAVLLFALTFGSRGNEWAWKARPWNSVDDFRRHQRYWAIAGFFLLGVLIATTILFRS